MTTKLTDMVIYVTYCRRPHLLSFILKSYMVLSVVRKYLFVHAILVKPLNYKKKV